MRTIDHADTVEDLTFLASHGVGLSEAARRTGFATAKGLGSYLRLHHDLPLLHRLTRQDYLPLPGDGPARHLRRAS